jgi:hypothetical protein
VYRVVCPRPVPWRGGPAAATIEGVQAPPPNIPITVVQVGSEEASRNLSMVDVAVAAFGLTGAIMAAAFVAGLIAGIAYVWWRSRHAVSTIEARGGNANFLRY